MAKHNQIGAFFLGCLVGCLSGAIVTMLFAPQSGKATRRLITDKSIELREKVRSSIEEKLTRPERVATASHSRKEAAVAGPSGSGGGRPRNIVE